MVKYSRVIVGVRKARDYQNKLMAHTLSDMLFNVLYASLVTRHLTKSPLLIQKPVPKFLFF